MAVILEPESLEFSGFLQGFDPPGAGNMYYLYVPAYEPESSLTFENPVDRGTVWIRTAGRDAVFSVTADGQTKQFELLKEDGWEWLDLGELNGRITLASQSAGLQIDRIFITPDPQQRPSGRGPDYKPDTSFAESTPQGVQAVAHSPFAVEVTWEHIDGARHYNVHAADHPGFAPSQSNLLYSPPGPGGDLSPRNGSRTSGRYIEGNRSCNASRNIQCESSRTDSLNMESGPDLSPQCVERGVETPGEQAADAAGRGVEPFRGQDARTVDWGVEPGSRLFYKVVAVDYDGTTTRPSQAVSIVTPEMVTVKVELDYREATGENATYTHDPAGVERQPLFLDAGQTAELTFDLPEGGDYVFWHRWRADRGGRFTINVEINGNDPLQMSHSYDLAGLYGDLLAEELIWNRFAFRGNVEPDSRLEHGVLQLESGRHTLRLTTGEPVYLDRLIITNDHSLVPDGRLGTF